MVNSFDSAEFKKHLNVFFSENKDIFGDSLDADHLKDFLRCNIASLDVKEPDFLDKRFLGGEAFGDSVTDYSEGINSMNYRSPEFVGYPDILFSGCSITYGVGVPATATWVSGVVNSVSPGSHVSLARPGISASKIVFDIIKYSKVYGKPKIICALFPDPYRLSLVTDSRYNSEKVYLHNDIETFPVDLHLARSKKSQIINYSKKPHTLRDILIPEIGFKSTLESILTLESFCGVGDIDLVWSSWDPATVALVQAIDHNESSKVFSSFSLDIYASIYGATLDDHVLDTNCRPEVYEKHPDHYVEGTDFGPHFGAHVHSHIAEAFIQELGRISK